MEQLDLSQLRDLLSEQVTFGRYENSEPNTLVVLRWKQEIEHTVYTIDYKDVLSQSPPLFTELMCRFLKKSLGLLSTSRLNVAESSPYFVRVSVRSNTVLHGGHPYFLYMGTGLNMTARCGTNEDFLVKLFGEEKWKPMQNILELSGEVTVPFLYAEVPECLI